ncbi:glycosyltransferase family 4 protein [Photobacterium lutimaris]|uniref:Glycosyltransferase family 1 protein n=1 Tax=Photobacterium lutimaris TaxID=388278 RepID=A0A2T3INC9_9GAMM|nr:glycosyltransferase family 4 protein [Photobacterium lutimaris]PSU29857.1 glycosyltransferase family 1 protein [Photobacterium lutimaris]TDR75281.1 glycosyltransferase involved in cell wall biosynthesis [Photobacterium lutimaris]
MKKLLFAINVGWYYDLHWQERVKSDMTEGFETHLCMSKPTNPTEPNMHSLSLTRSSVGLLDNLTTFYQALKIFNKIKPDTIHSVTIKPNIMFGLIALFARLPIFLTIPGMGSMFSQNTFKSKVIAKAILAIYRLVGKNRQSVFIFENKTDLQTFVDQKICSEVNAVTVPGSGVNIDEYSAPELDTTPQPLKLLFAARLLEGKGLRELVEATQNVKASGIDVVLNVAGIIDDDSNESIPLSQLEEWHQQGKVNWMGQINGGMQEVIAANDVIVLPTRYGEGLPRILIEANACRRPVITTDIGGCRDFVINGETGILVQICDLKALEDAIKKLSDREYCAGLGEYGRRRVEAFYTDKHVIDSYIEVYKPHR